MKERNFESEPGVFPFIPIQPPGPAIEPEPERHEDRSGIMSPARISSPAAGYPAKLKAPWRP